ncbi:MAG: hypothetical protein EXS67_01665 [Candidatus Margulisbacteria bacterium]|nr:hypothetical protein [Candidatus Margulisiibacteriota bacterium]
MDLTQTLKGLKIEVENHYNVKMLGLFGSYAKHSEHSDSDLDLLVSYGAGMSLFDDARLTLLLEERLHRKVDLVDESTLRPEFKSEILSTMIRL